LDGPVAVEDVQSGQLILTITDLKPDKEYGVVLIPYVEFDGDVYPGPRSPEQTVKTAALKGLPPL